MLDFNRLSEESAVVEPEELEDGRIAKPQRPKATLDEQYAKVMEAERADFPSRVRQRLQAEFDAGLDSLFSIMKDSKHTQSKTAATRTFFKLAYDYGVLESDPVKKLMMDMEAELTQASDSPSGEC
jgi:hypothetical protein